MGVMSTQSSREVFTVKNNDGLVEMGVDLYTYMVVLSVCEYEMGLDQGEYVCRS